MPTDTKPRERKEYDYGTRTLAEQLYVFRGLTYDEISRDLGVSPGQLRNWGQAGEWRDKREQYLTTKAQTVTRLIGIKESLLETLEGGIQPNTVHQMLSALGQADRMIEERASPGRIGEADLPALFLENLRFIVDTLRRIEPAGVALIARHFDTLIESFKEKRGS